MHFLRIVADGNPSTTHRLPHNETMSLVAGQYSRHISSNVPESAKMSFSYVTGNFS